jgi:hypothetical protein
MNPSFFTHLSAFLFGGIQLALFREHMSLLISALPTGLKVALFQLLPSARTRFLYLIVGPGHFELARLEHFLNLLMVAAMLIDGVSDIAEELWNFQSSLGEALLPKLFVIVL